MNLKDPETMNLVIGKALRYGVMISAAVIVVGTLALEAAKGSADTQGYLLYNPGTVPHDGIDVSVSGLASGIAAFSPFSWIELGVILLIATPVARVLISIFLFAAERDRLYVLITTVVLALLLFSLFVTPSIPGFHA
jgi:uncharacterized membrane protein